MIGFNLLPWRTHRLAYEKRVVKQLFVASICLPLVMLCITHYSLMAYNRVLMTQLNQIKRAVTPTHTTSSIIDPVTLNAIQAASLANSNTQKLFATLLQQPAALPANTLCISQMIREKDQLILQGQALTLDDLMQFLKTNPLFDAFSDIKLDEIHEASDGIHFKLIGANHVV